MSKWNLISIVAVAGMGILGFLTIVRNEMRLKDQRIDDRLESARNQQAKRTQHENEKKDNQEPIDVHPEGVVTQDGVAHVDRNSLRRETRS